MKRAVVPLIVLTVLLAFLSVAWGHGAPPLSASPGEIIEASQYIDALETYGHDRSEVANFRDIVQRMNQTGGTHEQLRDKVLIPVMDILCSYRDSDSTLWAKSIGTELTGIPNDDPRHDEIAYYLGVAQSSREKGLQISELAKNEPDRELRLGRYRDALARYWESLKACSQATMLLAIHAIEQEQGKSSQLKADKIDTILNTANLALMSKRLEDLRNSTLQIDYILTERLRQIRLLFDELSAKPGIQRAGFPPFNWMDYRRLSDQLHDLHLQLNRLGEGVDGLAQDANKALLNNRLLVSMALVILGLITLAWQTSRFLKQGQRTGEWKQDLVAWAKSIWIVLAIVLIVFGFVIYAWWSGGYVVVVNQKMPPW